MNLSSLCECGHTWGRHFKGCWGDPFGEYECQSKCVEFRLKK